MLNQRIKEYADLLVESGIATDNEIELVTTILGWNENSLNDILYARTSLHNLEQLKEELGIKDNDFACGGKKKKFSNDIDYLAHAKKILEKDQEEFFEWYKDQEKRQHNRDVHEDIDDVSYYIDGAITQYEELQQAVEDVEAGKEPEWDLKTEVKWYSEAVAELEKAKLAKNGFVVVDKFPAWAVYYAIYGEDDNLNEDDIAQIKRFFKENNVSGITEVLEDSYSVIDNDPAFGLPSDTYTVIMK